jgi:AAA+ ATPase superfamily predicted ATPase
VVVTGRRRVGKTRLLVEWVEQSGGVYFVADQSSPVVQRRYLTAALAEKLRGLDGVTFADWRALLIGVAERAIESKWTGPLVLDEIPYLVVQAPELPSVLQQFIDQEAKRARLTVAIAGSSQRMMQGIVMNASAPLFGRARAPHDGAAAAGVRARCVRQPGSARSVDGMGWHPALLGAGE